MEYAARSGYRVVLRASEVASGLNARRRGWRRVVEAAWRHEVRFLLVEYPDRLARFGRIVVTSDQEPKDAQAELVNDMLSVVTSFSAKLYGCGEGAGRARR